MRSILEGRARPGLLGSAVDFGRGYAPPPHRQWIAARTAGGSLALCALPRSGRAASALSLPDSVVCALDSQIFEAHGQAVHRICAASLDELPPDISQRMRSVGFASEAPKLLSLVVRVWLRASSASGVFNRCSGESVEASSNEDALLDNPLRPWVEDSVLVTTAQPLDTRNSETPFVSAAPLTPQAQPEFTRIRRDRVDLGAVARATYVRRARR